MEIEYCHATNRHTLGGARAGLAALLAGRRPASLLDVGCGTGTWLKAAQELGISDVFGIDGVAVSDSEFLVQKSLFLRLDLEKEWQLGRRFEIAICLEVGEHLSSHSAKPLVSSLVAHADTVLFSAACPGQEGEHHVNCQWPAYWQNLFNQEGFVCTDSPRWQLWNEGSVEPWYRQNMFMATRDPQGAGKEARIREVLHPAMFGGQMRNMVEVRQEIVRQISSGSESARWYLVLPFLAAISKLKRRLKQ